VRGSVYFTLDILFKTQHWALNATAKFLRVSAR
jgi:hypothetical protein